MGTLHHFPTPKPRATTRRTVLETIEQLPSDNLNVMLFYDVVPMELLAEAFSRGARLMAANPFGLPIYYQEVTLAEPDERPDSRQNDFLFDPSTQSFVMLEPTQDPICPACAFALMSNLMEHGWDWALGWKVGDVSNAVRFCSSCGRSLL